MNALILATMKIEEQGSGEVIRLSSHNLLLELEELFESSYKKLVGFACLLILPKEVAEDIVQDVFIATAIKVKNRMTKIDNLNAYIKSAIILKAKEYHRKNFRRATKDNQLNNDSVINKHNVDDTNENENITFAINALPQAQKECVVLKFYENLETKEIANYLGITESSVRTHLSRASQAIKSSLERIEG